MHQLIRGKNINTPTATIGGAIYAFKSLSPSAGSPKDAPLLGFPEQATAANSRRRTGCSHDHIAAQVLYHFYPTQTKSAWRSFWSNKARPCSSATLNAMLRMPSYASNNSSIHANKSGPISATVVRTGGLARRKGPQKHTGKASLAKSLSSILSSRI